MSSNNPWLAREHQAAPERSGDHRSAFQRDKARILHSAAFRRLQAKTQVLGVGSGDFYRTRLTHSLEASQIGQGIAAQLAIKSPQLSTELSLDSVLIEALCLAHDIGHPPYGHGGEIALNYMMRNQGGFEGNAQTFRIVSRLEPYTQHHGMNLSRRTLLGLVKYPGFLDELSNHNGSGETSFRQLKAADWHPPKGLYTLDKPLFDWMLSPLSNKDKDLFVEVSQHQDKHHKTRFKSFDCSIMELADDIAYSIHDLEDAITMGLVHYSDLVEGVVRPIKGLEIAWLRDHIELMAAKLFSEHHYERKDAIGALVNYFVTSVNIDRVNDAFEESLLGYNAVLPDQASRALGVFKQFIFKQVIRRADIQMAEYKGQQIVMELFDAFASDPERLLPAPFKVLWQRLSEQGKGIRAIADYISAMTDEHTGKLYAKLFMPKVSLDSPLL